MAPSFALSKKSNSPILAMAGTPLTNKNRQIRATAITEVNAAIKKTPFITVSFHRLALIMSSPCLLSFWILVGVREGREV